MRQSVVMFRPNLSGSLLLSSQSLLGDRRSGVQEKLAVAVRFSSGRVVTWQPIAGGTVVILLG